VPVVADIGTDAVVVPELIEGNGLPNTSDGPELTVTVA
jgi:hypothetical protein